MDTKSENKTRDTRKNVLDFLSKLFQVKYNVWAYSITYECNIKHNK